MFVPHSNETRESQGGDPMPGLRADDRNGG